MGKTSKPNEIIMACSKGLFFADLNDIGEIKVSINFSESYFRGQDVKAAIELKRDLVLTTMDMDLNVYLIDRKTKAVIRSIENPSGNDNPLCVRPIPMFDYEKLPFVLVRDREGITLVNTRTGSAYKSFETWYQQLPFPQMLLDTEKSQDAAILYVLEYTGRDSTLVKYEMTTEYIGGLRLMVKNDL